MELAVVIICAFFDIFRVGLLHACQWAKKMVQKAGMGGFPDKRGSPLAEVLPLTEVPSPADASEASPVVEEPSTELVVADMPQIPLAANDGGAGAIGAKAGLR